MGTCTYFSSHDWQSRVETIIADEWDVFDALDHITDNYSSKRVEIYLEDRDHIVGTDSLWLALEMVDTTEYDINPERVIEAWLAENDIPDNCPHDATNGEYCPFHDTETDSLSDSFAEAIRNTISPTFVGARGEVLSVTKFPLISERSAEVDLRHAEIDHLSIDRVVTNNNVRLDNIDASRVVVKNSEIRGDIVLTRCEATSILIRTCVCGGDLNLREATIGSSVVFDDFTVKAKTQMCGLLVGSSADLRERTLDGILLARGQHSEPQVELLDCVFEGRFQCTDRGVARSKRMRKPILGDIRCNDTTFESTVELTADFKGGDFGRTVFCGKFVASGCRVTGPLLFNNDSELTAEGREDRRETWIGPAEFQDETEFKDLRCEQDASFKDVTSAGEVLFEEPCFEGDVSFKDASFATVAFMAPTFHANAMFESATFESLELNDPGSTRLPPLVDLTKAEIRSGTVSRMSETPLPDEETEKTSKPVFPYIDLAGAILGNVTLEIDAPYSCFELLNLQRCAYEGFPFQAYHEDLERSWNLYMWRGETSETRPSSEFPPGLFSWVHMGLTRLQERACYYSRGPESITIEDLYAFEQTHLFALPC